MWQITSLDAGVFLGDDLHLLESVEFNHRIKHIVEIVEEVSWHGIDPDMLTRLVCFLLFLASHLFRDLHAQASIYCVCPHRYLGNNFIKIIMYLSFCMWFSWPNNSHKVVIVLILILLPDWQLHF